MHNESSSVSFYGAYADTSEEQRRGHMRIEIIVKRAERMGSGTKDVQIEAFINEPQPVASKPFPVNPAANSSKLAIGQERDAVNHPGKGSFNGE